MTIPEFFGELIAVQTFTKLHHLAVSKVTGSYATHMALNSFYEDLQDLTDGLIESCQGKHGVVKNIVVKSVSTSVPVIEKLKAFAKMLEMCGVFGEKDENSFIYNQIDEITTLTYQTIYKLENLQ